MQEYFGVLITRGAGFVGSHLLDHLMENYLEVDVLDNFQAGKLENTGRHIDRKNLRFVRGGIRDFDLVKSLVKGVDAVFHQAAIASVPQSFENPVLVNDVNVNGALNLLWASVDSDIRRFVYASSCAVYGEAENLPGEEDSRLKPLSPYGV